MPNLAAHRGALEVGPRRGDPPRASPGSDVGNMAILGYDPAEYHTGRAPIEAAAMGVDLAPEKSRSVATSSPSDADGTMVDFAAGHITSEQSHPIVAALDAALGGGRNGVRFHPGVEYRHLCVAPADWADAECVPPHDLTGQLAVLPVRARRREAHRIDGRLEAGRVRCCGRGRFGGVADLALGPRHRAGDAAVRRPVRGRRSVELGRGSRARARRAHRDRCGRRPGRDRRLRQRLRGATRRVSGVPSRPRLLPAARRSHRRSRSPERGRRKGAAARTLGRRGHRPALRTLSMAKHSGCCSCPTTPRRAR